MSRLSGNVYENGILVDGFDYTRQAWVVNGKYVTCGHPSNVECSCYGRKHAGELSQERERLE